MSIEFVEDDAKKEIDEQNAMTLKQADAIKVTDQATYEQAGALVQVIATRIGAVEDWFKPLKDNAWKAHKAICDKEKEALAKLKQARVDLDKLMTAWYEEQERLAAEARRKAREEEERRERERKAKEEEAERERQRKLAEAQEAEAQGDKEKADQLIEEAAESEAAEPEPEPEPEPVQPAHTAPEKVKGIGVRKVYTAEVVDLKALILAVAHGTVPLKAIKINESFINKMAGALGDDFNYPGCKLRVLTKQSVSKLKKEEG